MAIERPTFHESWYRVAELHPRLRSTVQVSRQHFRGQSWHVVQDHTNNAFFRLAEPAYRFIGLLDGKRTVAEAWKFVNDQMGDDAPTQGEVIQLLGQLYTANLLMAEVTPDTHTLFARYKKRKTREITGYLMNIMFARLPIFDPDAFLERWNSLLGLIFSPLGLVVWLVLIGTGVYSIMNVPGWQDKISDRAASMLSPDNLLVLYVAFAFIKAFHEMGHAISCKKFGRQGGTGGEVHVIGIMFLVFTPVPYVDASSSWALTNKWHRAIVGAAGMWVELGIASIAAMVWANTGESGNWQWLHAFSYNVMFVASFSTIVFNANPLLRYDGYYILSDILEIPNLGQRANEFIYYLVKKYVWNVRLARNPAYSRSEAGWMFVYSIASFIMRAFVSVSILFYLAGVLNGTMILLAAVMAVAGVLTWVLVPIGRFLYYLATSPELSRVRGRAVITSGLFAAALIAGIGIIPFPDRARAQGVVEPADYQDMYAANDGFVTEVSPAITSTARTGGDDRSAMGTVEKDAMIMSAENPDLESQYRQLLADRKRLIVQNQKAIASEKPAEHQLAEAAIKATDKQIAIMEERLGTLRVKAPMSGVVVAPELETRKTAFVKHGEKLGFVARLDKLVIRAAASNDIAGQLDTEAQQEVEIRVSGRPEVLMAGRISGKVPAGKNQLPSAALGYQVGGELKTSSEDKQGTKTEENFFEVRIDDLRVKEAPKEDMAVWDKEHEIRRFLLPGQRVVVRFTMKKKPLAQQAWTSLLQLFQRKFQT